jgi:hypothetical protein
MCVAVLVLMMADVAGGKKIEGIAPVRCDVLLSSRETLFQALITE